MSQLVLVPPLPGFRDVLGQDRTRWDIIGRVTHVLTCSCAALTIAATDGLNALRIGMTDEPPRQTLWGKGRVAFVAKLDTIRWELGQGLSLTAIYDRHKAALGIGYSAFIKLVRRHASDAQPLKRRSAGSMVSPPSPAPLPPVSTVTSIPEANAYARHEPAGRPDFKHHGIVQEGEPEQLFGPGFLPKRRS